ncbi:choice-of-anchor A family protein [Nocardioides conyzicola]|uniref:Choice-of-anchor A family protein n=1 Tax=Nocardioides conyzicola TaxID=1651781 RepID=A0ABP8XNB4_9ACTN
MPVVIAVVASAALVSTVAPFGGRADATPTCATGVAASNPFGIASGWTEFIEGSGHRGSESEGAIAWGGNLDANGMTVGTRLTSGSSDPTLVVAGTHGGFNLQKGSAYLSPASGVNFNGGGHYLASNPVDFATAFAGLRALSTSWGAAAATGTVSAGTTGGNAALVLTGTSASLNVFTLSAGDAAALASGKHLGLNVPSGATTIINVPGATPTIAGQAWLGSGSSWSQAADGTIKGAYAGLVWNFPDATAVTVSYGAAFPGTILAPNAAVTIASAGHTIGQVLAKSFSSNYETHLNNFPSEACVPSPPSAPGTSDVTVTKSASTASPHGGDTVVYTLTATNVGNATATGVSIRDQLPGGVTFVSASPPCTRSAGVVTCNVGSLNAGASTSVTVTVTANPIAGAGPVSHPQATHWLTPYKAEAQVDLEPGQQKSVTLACTGSDILSDGQFRVDHVDQGTGAITDVRVLSAQSTALGTWKGVIRNDATGRAQAKAFIVCLPARTESADRQTGYADSHQHALSADAALVTTTRSYGVGRSTASLTCPTGTVAVAPGFDLSSAGATLVGSETGAAHPRVWTFTLDVTAPVTATFTARCLRTTTSAVYGHTHELLLTHVVQTVSVPGNTASEGNEYQVICPDDGKGVVATFELPSGVTPFGNDPRLKARAFRLYNQSGTAKTATLDLVCLKDRTSTEQMGTDDPVPVVNTATVTSTSADANDFNNSASATVTVQPGAATASIVGVVRVARSGAAMTVLSSMPGTGVVKLRVAGKVVARGTVKLRAGSSATAKVKLSKQARRGLARLDRVRVVLDPTRGRTVVKAVRLG